MRKSSAIVRLILARTNVAPKRGWKMKRLLVTATVMITLAVAYIASPLVTAWSIREAVRNGNSNYLAAAIDWPGVRATLAPSLQRYALDGTTAIRPADGAAKPGLWQRFKAYFGGGVITSAIDSYLTPEGLPQLFQMRKAYRDYVSNGGDESALPLMERASRAWKRIKRAEFTGPATFEIDMQDKHEPSRMYLGTLTLGATGWKLTALRMHVDEMAASDVPDATEADGTVGDEPAMTTPSAPDMAAPERPEFRALPAAKPTIRREQSAGRALRQNFWISAAEAAQPRRRDPHER